MVKNDEGETKKRHSKSARAGLVVSPSLLGTQERKEIWVAKTRNEKLTLVRRFVRQFPVGRVLRHLKKGRFARRVALGAAIYLAAV